MEGKESSKENRDSDSDHIFVENIPHFGEVSLLFYISDICEDKETLAEQIRSHGGNVALSHECFTYQIWPKKTLDTIVAQEAYYKGLIIDSEWITESIKQNKLLPKETFILRKQADGKEFDFNKGKIPYTIREAVTIYQWIKGQKLQKSKRTWQNMVDRSIIFCRSADSLKNFWKTNEKVPLEDCITEMLKNNKKYCHQHQDPIFPNDGIILQQKEPVEEVDKRSKTIFKKGAGYSHQDLSSQSGSRPTSTSKAPIIKMDGELDFDEDIRPLPEEKDYNIDIVEVIDELPSDQESTPENENDSQLEVEVNDSVFESSCEPKPSGTPKSKRDRNVESSQPSTEIYRKATHKEMLSGLINENISDVEIPKNFEEEKENTDSNSKSYFSKDIASFVSIKKKLKEISSKHKKDFEEVMNLFEQCSCRYDVLEQFLKTGRITNKMWKSLEDFVLLQPHMNEEAYGLLLKEKGKQEVDLRKEFLNLT